MQRHGIECVQLLTVQLFPQTSPSIAEPHLNPSFGQFCSVKIETLGKFGASWCVCTAVGQPAFSHVQILAEELALRLGCGLHWRK